MTVMWIRYFGTAGAKHSNSRKFDSQIPQGYHVPHYVGNLHWRIPNSSVRTNSSATRRTSSLSLKKWLNCMIFPKASLEGFGRCRILSWASLGNFSLVFPRPPLIVRCFLWLKKDKMKLHKQKSSCFMFLKWIPSLQDHTNFFTFKFFRKSSEIQSRRTSFLGVDFLCKYKTPHRLIDLCTLTNALVP